MVVAAVAFNNTAISDTTSLVTSLSFIVIAEPKRSGPFLASTISLHDVTDSDEGCNGNDGVVFDIVDVWCAITGDIYVCIDTSCGGGMFIGS